VSSGHFSTNIIVQKILHVGYWWPSLYHDTTDYCHSYDLCYKHGNLSTQNLEKHVTNLLVEPFTKWGLDFLGPIKLITNYKEINISWLPLIMQPNGWKPRPYGQILLLL
jgi:hypothetical protein